jgi:hypothetical protein
VKRAVVLLVLLLMGCSSSDTPSPAPDPSPTPSSSSWLSMLPEDVRQFDGPGGKLLLIYVDESYAIDHTNASALTWKLPNNDYATDFFVEDDDGSLWWYGRRGVWRAGLKGEEPRLVLDAATADKTTVVEFDDLALTLERGAGPVQAKTPQGVYRPMDVS